MKPARSVAFVVAALVAVAACGGESGPIAAPDQPDDDGGQSSVPTVDELPDELAGVVRPVNVSGEALPPLQTNDLAADPARGMKAPVIAGEDFDGRSVRIDAFAGGPTMVVFLAHWCPVCNDEIPVINDLRDEGRLPDDLNVVGVSTSVRPGSPNFPPDRWLELRNWTYPVIADDVDLERQLFVAADAMGLTAFPFVVLIDGDGVVQARWSGARSGDYFTQLIESSLSLG